jgi:PAS domain S-box-containing protein
LAEKPKILVLDPRQKVGRELLERLANTHEVVVVTSVVRGLALLRHGQFAGVFADTADLGLVEQIGVLLQADQILDAIADGVALVDPDLTIRWANPEFLALAGKASVAGENFYTALGSPEIRGPDYCPFTTATRSGNVSSTVLRRADNRYFRVSVTPVRDSAQNVTHVISLTRDVTAEVQQQQKLRAIHQAGSELGDLSADELAEMDVEQRIELLKSNILRHTKDLLNLDSIEIRMLDRTNGRLEPLLCEGMRPDAANRPLYAQPQGNGVTGFVAATGGSYLCEDTANDPLYLPGAPNAKSSITVPLSLHDEVIGTFNVESPEPGKFTEEDVQFLEIYARDVAVAINTLELLQAQKLTATTESVELISREVALPVDAILRDATCVLDRYIGHEPDVAERLRRILANARDVKQLIQNVGEQIVPAPHTHAPVPRRPRNPLLVGRRILLIDNDEAVRQAAHTLLGRYGCVVETASEGQEALTMARLSQYDVFIADIRLPDMGGFEIFSALRELQPAAATVLMTGFGYDASHAIVKARREGLHTVLYKPFRVDRLIAAIESALAQEPAPQEPAAGGVAEK